MIDGRTSETRDIRAGLPQGSPVSPVLFILSVSAMFQWLKDRHPMLQAISFVDDIGLVVECSELGKWAGQLERIARDAMRWGSDNKVEFEVSKIEVLVFSRRRKVLRAAKDAVIRIGEQTFTIKQGATKWLGFWLDPKLSFKTHFENRMASAKGALHRVASLGRSNGGLSINLMRRVVVAAVTSVALYGSEIWPAGSTEEITVVAEQPSKSYYRLVTVNAPSLPSAGIVFVLCQRSSRSSSDQICDTRAECGWGPSHASIPTY